MFGFHVKFKVLCFVFRHFKWCVNCTPGLLFNMCFLRVHTTGYGFLCLEVLFWWHRCVCALWSVNLLEEYSLPREMVREFQKEDLRKLWNKLHLNESGMYEVMRWTRLNWTIILCSDVTITLSASWLLWAGNSRRFSVSSFPLYSAFSWFPKNNSVSGQYIVLLPLHQGYLEGLIQYKYLHFRFLQKPFIVLWAYGVYQSYSFFPPVFCVINDYGYSAPFCESSRF